MKMNRSLLHWVAAFLLVGSVPASAANINVVWTSEVGSFAPQRVSNEAKMFEK